MSRHIAVETVRAWHLTVCHDLCLPVVPIMVRTADGSGDAGRFVGRRTSDGGGFVGVNVDGLVLGQHVAARTTTEWSVDLFVYEGLVSEDYLKTLAHELRHAWQFYNRVPATEEDCQTYADRFCRRFARPDTGRYTGLVDQAEYDQLRRRRDAEQAKRSAKLIRIGLWMIPVVIVLVGLGVLNSLPSNPNYVNPDPILAHQDIVTLYWGRILVWLPIAFSVCWAAHWLLAGSGRPHNEMQALIAAKRRDAKIAPRQRRKG